MRTSKSLNLVLIVLLILQTMPVRLAAQDEKIIIAVVDFRNTSQDESLDYLEQAIPESIITGLARSGQLEIVERSQLNTAMEEMKLGMSGIVDEETAIELGRAVGANAILVGSYLSVGKTIRINARVIDVRTAKVLKAESVQGDVEKEIFTLMDDLAASIIQQLTGAEDSAASPEDSMGRPERDQPSPDVAAEQKPVYHQWWFWVLVGGGILGGKLLLSSGGSNTSAVDVQVTIP